MGVQTQELTPELARSLGSTSLDGAVVTGVDAGSPAERAGVRRGDVVLRIDGQPATEEAVDGLRERLKPGDSVRLRLRREDREMDQTVVAAERREQMVWVGPGDEGEVFSVRVPRERIRMRMDTVRANIERLLTRVDSLHGRLELLHGDSDVVIRMGRERGEPVRVRRGNVRVYRDSAGGRRVQVDSVIILHDSLLARHRALERAHIEAFPFRDLDPEVPFYMEMGRRGVAGAELVEMNAGLARYFHTERGLLVAQVSEGTPMARAGWRPET
jgi:S1-C subfamily serine protease